MELTLCVACSGLAAFFERDRQRDYDTTIIADGKIFSYS
jgi:hypothetical protein